MATASVTNITRNSCWVVVSGLEHYATDYDNFRFRFSCHGKLAIDGNWSGAYDSNTLYLRFENESYLGNNWLVPDTDYTLVTIVTYNGVDYVLNTVYFSTDSISPPSGSIIPTLFTKVKEQRYDTCVPMCLSTAMDRFRAMKVGDDYENYSVSYIFGNGGYSWGMYFEEAVINCKSAGSPRWDLVSTSFTDDEKSISDSRNTYNNADNYAKSNALLQKFTGHTNIDPYNTAAVKSAIQNYGCFMLNIRVPNNLYYVGGNGIIPQPNYYTGVNHSLLVIGLTTKNGKPHWIVQNSWGTDWGDNGYGYLPYDWGIGADPPSRSNMDSPSSWTLESYAVYNNSVSNYVPPTPTNVTAVKNGNLSALVSWNSVLSGALYTIFASRKNQNEWYVKGRTTSTSITITFDNSSEYEIRVVTVSSNLYSRYSDLVYVTLLNIVPWEWWTPKVTGNVFNLTLNEWKAFLSKINEVRNANGLGSKAWSYNTVYFYAYMFLDAANAINEINGQVAPQCLSVKSMQDDPWGESSKIYASYWTNLKTALNNAIPS